MAQNRLDYRDALGLIANAETIVSFRRAIYEILKAIRFGGVYFLAPLVADRRVGRVFWNVGFPKSWEQSYRESGRWDDPLPNFALNLGSAFRWSDAENVGNVDDRGLSYLSRLRTDGMGEGKSNAMIAEILGITKNSVDSYVKRIFSKLDVSDRTAAAARAVSLGLISPGKHFREAAHRPRWLA